MGYYIHLNYGNWEIEESPESLAAVREMPKKYHAVKRGGSSSGEKWFSWMNDENIENAETVESVFQALGFETSKSHDGFTLEGYESKTGQEDLFLAVLAPWTKDGSYLEFTGEDNNFWRYSVKDGRMYYEDGVREYKQAEPYAYQHVTLLGDNQWRSALIDPADIEGLNKALADAEAWEQEKQAYFDKLRAEREAQSTSS